MAKEFSEAETVAQIANGLIPNYHPELATAKILYIFVSKASTKNGQEVWGKAKKLSGLFEWYAERDFLIEVAKDKWDGLNANERTALVDHLLERCTGEEDEENGGAMKWKMRDPEVQEFATILQRYGAWHKGLNSFISIAKSVKLDEIIAEEAEIDLSEDETEEEHVGSTE
jgi:hypothetical protein